MNAVHRWMLDLAVRAIGFSWGNSTMAQSVVCFAVVLVAFGSGVYSYIDSGLKLVHLTDVIVLIGAFWFFHRNGLTLKTCNVLLCVLVITCVMMWPLIFVGIVFTLSLPEVIPYYYAVATFLFCAALWKNLSISSAQL
jgi:hypothetical protein